MPDDKKHKGKSEAKEQRKLRHGRHQQPVDRKEKTDNSKKSEQLNETKVPPKPVYEEPGPEFYKNLKRETEEILKITEEANSKYKKKEIQSNWSKYEMPIESYEEIEESELMGADYEKLTQIPLSIGGHFQFKHEKSWDINTGPSLYDKYFQIDMDNLATALCTIPFYERNNIEKSIFSEIDVSNMENRSVRYKQKYYNDKSFTTPESEARDKIISSLYKDDKNGNDIEIAETLPNQETDIVIEETKAASPTTISHHDKKSIELNLDNTQIDLKPLNKTLATENVEDEEDAINIDKIENKILENENEIRNKQEVRTEKLEITSENIELPKPPKAADLLKTEPTKSVLESPEDLEKWLDDFLDS